MLDGKVLVVRNNLRLMLLPKRGFSQAFYREKLHEKHYGYPTLESFMVGFWEGWATSKGTPACQLKTTFTMVG